MKQPPRSPGGAGGPAAAAGSGAEPPGEGWASFGLSPKVGKVLAKILEPHLAGMESKTAAWLEHADDAELAKLALRAARASPRGARRAALHLLAASVVELEGFEPASLRLRAVTPGGIPQEILLRP